MYRESTETEAQEAIDPALAGVEFSQAPVAAVHFFRVIRDFFSYSVASCLIWMCLQLCNDGFSVEVEFNFKWRSNLVRRKS